MTEETTMTDGPTGLTFTRYISDVPDRKGRRTRYKLAKPDGTTFDMSTSEWIAVIDLYERWEDES